MRRGVNTAMPKLATVNGGSGGGVLSRQRFAKNATMSEDVNNSEPDIAFNYADTDTYVNELNEIYAYSELCEFTQNADAYRMFADMHKVGSGGDTVITRRCSCRSRGRRPPSVSVARSCST